MESRNHLLIIIHGILGLPENMNYLKSCFENMEQYYLHIITCNQITKQQKTNTLDGIEAGSKRILQEVQEIIENNSSLEKISILGFSLGGIYSRYLSALAFDLNTGLLFGKLKPIAFISIATPHISIRSLLPRLFYWFKNIFIFFLSTFYPLFNPKTIKELFLEDGDEEMDEPLLLKMTKKNQILPFFESLSAFKERIIYSNVQWDWSVPYPSSSILGSYWEDFERPIDFIPSFEFPSIISIHNHKPVLISSNYPFYEFDEKKEIIKEMIDNLNQLSWKRVDVSLPMCFAHKCIVGNGNYFHRTFGKDVGQHLRLLILKN